MKLAGKILSNILLAIMLVAVALFALPRLFGVQMFAVLSGSMTPQYKVGDLVYAVPAGADEIEVGDPITYVLDEELTLVTHRVIEVDTSTDPYFYYTQGDANPVPDGAPVAYPNVVGVVRFSLPFVGYFLSALAQPFWRIITITAVLVLVMLSALLGIAKPEETEDKTKQEPAKQPEPKVRKNEPLQQTGKKAKGQPDEIQTGKTVYKRSDHDLSA